jgi:hypothetical protein
MLPSNRVLRSMETRPAGAGAVLSTRVTAPKDSENCLGRAYRRAESEGCTTRPRRKCLSSAKTAKTAKTKRWQRRKTTSVQSRGRDQQPEVARRHQEKLSRQAAPMMKCRPNVENPPMLFQRLGKHSCTGLRQQPQTPPLPHAQSPARVADRHEYSRRLREPGAGAVRQAAINIR